MHNDLEFMKTLQIAFICRYIPSGSIYMHSLFDAHPEVLTIPGVIILDALCNENIKSAEESLILFLKANPFFYDTSKMDDRSYNNSGLFRLGENSDEGIVTDRQRFEQYYVEFMTNIDITPENLILALFYAYGKAHNQIIKENKVILLHPHSFHKLYSLYKIFPKGKTIVAVRHPIRGYISTMKLLKQRAKMRGYYSIHFGSLLLNEFYAATFFGREDIEVRFVRVEDFSNYKDYILRELCKYMGIRYDICLESSTFGGKKYWGANTSYKSNHFQESRHNFPLAMSNQDKIVLSLLNKRFGVIKGYKLFDISAFYKYSAVFWLLMPMEEDIKLVKECFVKYPWETILNNSGEPILRTKILLTFLKERLQSILCYCQYKKRYNCYCDKLRGNTIRSDTVY